MKNKKRIFGLDLVRAFAFLLVILVHSFNRSGYNVADMQGIKMFLLLMIRCIAFMGVLLFIILTGYCKSNKEINKKHYKSIVKILEVYLVISIITIFFRKFVLHDTKNVYEYITGIFNCTAIPYAWYIEMYIGLFLLIPFLNILYKNIETKKQKQILIITLLCLSSVPDSVANLNVAGHSLDFLPNWWVTLYPLSLYYVGCYIKEYQINLNKAINFIIILFLVFIQTFMMYFYCQGSPLYDKLIFVYENNLPAILLSISIFLFLYNIKTYNKGLANFVYFFSSVSLGGYLFSYCWDSYIYTNELFFKRGSSNYFVLSVFIITPIVYICSALSSFIVDKLINGFNKLINISRKRHLKRIVTKEQY